MEATKKALATAAIMSLTLLNGCSGGGDDSPQQDVSSRAANNAETEEPITRVEPNLEHCTDPVELNSEMLALINQTRASSQVCRGQSYPAVAALQLDARLENAAIVHADDMATHNFLSHSGSDGSSAGNRADRQDYDWVYISENLGGNYPDSAAILKAWMDSNEGHCEVIMAARAKDLGAACIYQEGSQYTSYWALELGDT